MNWLFQAKEAYTNIISSKLRSFLAVLGILVGTGSVVAMVSGGQLATSHALKQFSELGTDLLAVSIFAGKDKPALEKAQQEITVDHVLLLQAKIPDITAIAPYTTVYGDVTYQNHSLQASIIASISTLQAVIHIGIDQGRFLTPYDTLESFCVIGSDVAAQLKKLGIKNPVYKQILVADRYFTIIGVAAPWKENSFFNQDVNKSLIIPLQSAKLVSQYATINSMVMRLAENVNIDAVQSKIEVFLKKHSPNKQFFFRSAKQLIDSMINQRNTLTLLLALIGSISLLVGGIGVMNIMLVSVVERRREIGIRKAVGARNKDIRQLFLVESVALSLMGGLLGVIIGILTSYLIAMFADWKFEIFLLPPLIGFLVSVTVGIFFGFYPAYKASLLDPIETLRAD